MYNLNPTDLNKGFAAAGRAVKGQQGYGRVRAGLKALVDAGLISNPNDLSQVQGALRALPGPFGSGDPNAEIVPFLAYAEQFADSFDPTGGPGGRFFSIGGDPRNDVDPTRAECDLWGVISSDVVAGSTGAESTFAITATDTVYHDAVLWLWTSSGKVRNITELKVDSRTFYLGPSASIPADIADVSLEPHPMRQGIWLGEVTKSLSVKAFVETSSTTVHVDVLLDARIDGQQKQRPGARVLHRGRSMVL